MNSENNLPILQVEALNLAYGEELVFNNLSFQINSGDKTALTGESGSGKTSFLNILAGFVTNYKGEITFDGLKLNAKNIRSIRQKFAWLPQETGLREESVKQLLLAPFQFEQNRNMLPDDRLIDKTLEKVLLEPSILLKNTTEISGGQKQRILLAGCLLQKKQIFILDEPTSALDESTRKQVTDAVMKTENITVIASTHDAYWIRRSDKVIDFSKR